MGYFWHIDWQFDRRVCWIYQMPCSVPCVHCKSRVPVCFPFVENLTSASFICSGSTAFTITRADKMFHIAWGSPAHLRSLLTDNLWREYKSKISKGQFSWTGGVRWVESGLRGCSTGGGEETELGDASHQLKTLQVTRETLSSRAGAMVIYSNLIQEVALGNLVTIFVCYQGGGPHAWQWPGEEAGEEVKTRQVEPVGDGGVVEGGVENSSASRLRFEADCI